MKGGYPHAGYPGRGRPYNVFLGHSGRDAKWADRFAGFLAPLESRNLLRLWVDTVCLEVGDPWEAAIERAISRSDLALVLVSSHFLHPGYALDTELPLLEKYGVPLAPVLIGDCLYEYVPALERVQWLGRNALSKLPEGELDEEMALLSRRLFRRLEAADCRRRDSAPQPTADHMEFFRPLFEARRSVEPVGARLAARRVTHEHLAHMANALAVMRRSAGTSREYLQADMHFHQTMLTASGDPDFARFGRTVADVLHRRTRQGFMPATPDPLALHLHEGVFHSMRVGDPLGAERAMAGIIDEACSATAAGRA